MGVTVNGIAYPVQDGDHKRRKVADDVIARRKAADVTSRSQEEDEEIQRRSRECTDRCFDLVSHLMRPVEVVHLKSQQSQGSLTENGVRLILQTVAEASGDEDLVAKLQHIENPEYLKVEMRA